VLRPLTAPSKVKRSSKNAKHYACLLRKHSPAEERRLGTNLDHHGVRNELETWNILWTVMQRILSKFRRHERRDSDTISKDPPDENITIQQVFHYRKQKGVNLGTFSFRLSCPLSILINAGSWFVLERWITDSPFQHAFQPAQSDLDVARGINAKQILERHWDTWMTEEDWVWISEHGINTVRIPVSCFLLMSIKVV
jgi:hypothetical protein